MTLNANVLMDLVERDARLRMIFVIPTLASTENVLIHCSTVNVSVNLGGQGNSAIQILMTVLLSHARMVQNATT